MRIPESLPTHESANVSSAPEREGMLAEVNREIARTRPSDTRRIGRFLEGRRRAGDSGLCAWSSFFGISVASLQIDSNGYRVYGQQAPTGTPLLVWVVTLTKQARAQAAYSELINTSHVGVHREQRALKGRDVAVTIEIARPYKRRSTWVIH